MTIFGRNNVSEALKSSFTSTHLYLQDQIHEDEKIATLLKLARERSVPIDYLPLKKLSKFLKTNDHQGVGLDVNFKALKLKELLSVGNAKTNSSMIYISNPTYDHNIGAIIRTAECAGLAGVLLPKNIQLSPGIAKTSAGAVFHIPIAQASIFDTIKEFTKDGYEVVAIERGGKNLYSTKLVNKTLFIIGGEDKGIAKLAKESSAKIVELPQFGNLNSLNMSVAAGIVIYEHIRQISSDKNPN